jgi:hypothetical protein
LDEEFLVLSEVELVFREELLVLNMKNRSKEAEKGVFLTVFGVLGLADWVLEPEDGVLGLGGCFLGLNGGV